MVYGLSQSYAGKLVCWGKEASSFMWNLFLQRQPRFLSSRISFILVLPPVCETRRGVQAIFLGIVTWSPHLRVRSSSLGEIVRERGSTPAMDDCTDDSVKEGETPTRVCQDVRGGFPFTVL